MRRTIVTASLIVTKKTVRDVLCMLAATVYRDSSNGYAQFVLNTKLSCYGFVAKYLMCHTNAADNVIVVLGTSAGTPAHVTVEDADGTVLADSAGSMRTAKNIVEGKYILLTKIEQRDLAKYL